MGIFKYVIDEVLYRAVKIISRRTQRHALGTFVVPTHDEVGLRILSTGNFEAKNLEGLRLHAFSARVEEVAVDVGANIGVFSVELSHYFKSVIAIEPNPITFHVLQANLAINKARVLALQLGASNSDQTMALHMPTAGDLGWATLHPNAPDFTSFQVHVRPIDDILSENSFDARVGFIKIDVERHELEVLRGCRRTIEKHFPDIFFEANSFAEGKNCCSYLEEMGYVFKTFRRGLTGSVKLSDINLSKLRPGSCIYARRHSRL